MAQPARSPPDHGAAVRKKLLLGQPGGLGRLGLNSSVRGQFKVGVHGHEKQARSPDLSGTGDRDARREIVLKVPDGDAFRPDLAAEVVTPFEDTGYGTKEITVRDPEGPI
ncbi:MAG: hypothetical protein ABSE84_10395 [Isosphaeraceae bacterium]